MRKFFGITLILIGSMAILFIIQVSFIMISQDKYVSKGTGVIIISLFILFITSVLFIFIIVIPGIKLVKKPKGLPGLYLELNRIERNISTDAVKLTAITELLSKRDTQELLDIWSGSHRAKWDRSTVTALREILIERGEIIRQERVSSHATEAAISRPLEVPQQKAFDDLDNNNNGHPIQQDKDASLVSAINANNWDDIYKLSINFNFAGLKKVSFWFQDKLDGEFFFDMVKTIKGGEDKFDNQHEKDLYRLRLWLEDHKDEINNKYMYSFIRASTFENGIEEIKVQTLEFEKLTKEFPERWETFFSLSTTWRSDRSKSIQFLSLAKKLANNEAICLWNLVLFKNDINRVLEYGNKGYAINENNLFLINVAKILKNLGKSSEAKKYYERVINSEPEYSSISRMAKEEIKRSYFSFTQIIRIMLLLTPVLWVFFVNPQQVLGGLIAGILLYFMFPLCLGLFDHFFGTRQ